MRRLSGYPQWFYGFALVVLATLFASGLVLIPHLLEFRLDMDSPVQVSSGLRLGSAAVHCFIAFVAIGLVGSLANVHMRAGWHRKLNRTSGLLLLGLFLCLLATAVGIYYFGDEDLSRFASLGHTLVGLALLLFFLWHSLRARWIRGQQQKR